MVRVSFFSLRLRIFSRSCSCWSCRRRRVRSRVNTIPMLAIPRLPSTGKNKQLGFNYFGKKRFIETRQYKNKCRSRRRRGGGGGCYFRKNWVGTYEQNMHFSLRYLGPDQNFDTIINTCPLNQYPGSYQC